MSHLLDFWITEGRYSKPVSFHMLQTVYKEYCFHENKTHLIEKPHHIVFRNNLRSLQHICFLPKHGSLILLHTNFWYEHCQFSTVSSTLSRNWKTPSLLRKLQVSCHHLEQYLRQFTLSLQHSAKDVFGVQKLEECMWFCSMPLPQAFFVIVIYLPDEAHLDPSIKTPAVCQCLVWNIIRPSISICIPHHIDCSFTE